MKKTLYLKKMGCDFWKDADIRQVSDVGNYRVRTLDECIKGKDGRMYFLEFTQYDKYNYRGTHKRTGKELKHMVKELVMAHALHLDTEFTDDKGSWSNLKLENEIHSTPMLYTLDNILKVVNQISVDTYTDIEFVNREER